MIEGHTTNYWSFYLPFVKFVSWDLQIKLLQFMPIVIYNTEKFDIYDISNHFVIDIYIFFKFLFINMFCLNFLFFFYFYKKYLKSK